MITDSLSDPEAMGLAVAVLWFGVGAVAGALQ